MFDTTSSKNVLCLSTTGSGYETSTLLLRCRPVIEFAVNRAFKLHIAQRGPMSHIQLPMSLVRLCGDEGSMSGTRTALGHELPRRALSRAAARPPITDAEARGRRGRDGPCATFCTAEKQRAFSPSDHVKSVTDLPIGP
jgi:hypothetical protein